MFWPFFWAKKNQRYWVNFSSIVGIWIWFLGLASDKKTNRNRKPSMGWWLNPSRHPPVGKIPLPPAIQQPERLAKWKNGSPSQSHGPVFGDAPYQARRFSHIRHVILKEMRENVLSYQQFVPGTCIAKTPLKSLPAMAGQFSCFQQQRKLEGFLMSSGIHPHVTIRIGWFHSIRILIHSNASCIYTILHTLQTSHFWLTWDPFPLLGGGNSNNFYFHPENWGNDEIWREYFSIGWRKTTN